MKKAYDNLNAEKIWQTSRDENSPTQFIKSIQILYQN
jgi:hypothetical protein